MLASKLLKAVPEKTIRLQARSVANKKRVETSEEETENDSSSEDDSDSSTTSTTTSSSYSSETEEDTAPRKGKNLNMMSSIHSKNCKSTFFLLIF